MLSRTTSCPHIRKHFSIPYKLWLDVLSVKRGTSNSSRERTSSCLKRLEDSAMIDRARKRHAAHCAWPATFRLMLGSIPRCPELHNESAPRPHS